MILTADTKEQLNADTDALLSLKSAPKNQDSFVFSHKSMRYGEN